MTGRVRAALAVVVIVATAAGCRPPKTPSAPSAAAPAAAAGEAYPVPDVPPGVPASDDVRSRHFAAWRQLQSGDTRGAARAFTQILKSAPAFYPAEAGLGFAQLSAGQYRSASAHFSAVIAANDRYLPAWIGQSDALLGLHKDADAMTAMARVLALDPKRDTVRSRLEMVRFRMTQALIESGRRDHAAHRLVTAEQSLEQALALSPQSTIILHELALVEVDAKKLDEAETHARRATEIDARDADGQATLGSVLEARGKYRDAAAAYARAAAIDPRPAWTARAADLREKAEMAALPAGFADLPQAPSISRAETAAFIGIRLAAVIDGAPRRVTDVATDIRTHWAAPWIVPVTRAGVMTIYANHTFQPAATLRRSDLASVAAALVRIVGADRRADLAQWQAARPRFPDLSATHVSYASAALAVAAGAMHAEADGRFAPAERATGADLDAVVRRISQLVTR